MSKMPYYLILIVGCAFCLIFKGLLEEKLRPSLYAHTVEQKQTCDVPLFWSYAPYPNSKAATYLNC